ncbi:sugar ABC transporter substrate-binding protein [Peribacillus cavernae]|uniref:Sugar ABC transporter substrate-binding protein n=1 Tax=Peribacillus cavernae TaxID=1674310 RepID=A0A433HVU5_9BACI|nr:sugar ABC transporter substrate-binding protein [Peribacillus cavernae]MDQ0220725.1 ribose transport system substrate-binding protein [Peribacillus cavernae]RUQ32438.1 sugar ABC transporter substrate-binding protein [Peribacillus cavernae]
MKKLLGLIVLLVVLTFTLSACGGEKTSSNTKEDNNGKSSSSGGESTEGKRVSSALMGLGFEFMVMLNDSSKETAKENGMDMQVFDANTDADNQATQMQNIIATKPDTILLSAVDAKLIIPSAKAAKNAGIPVFRVESKPLDEDYETWVGYDNYKAGEMAADYIAKVVGEKGTVLEQRGMVGATGADLRSEGFNKRMKKYPNIKVVTLNNEWVADKAFSNTLDAFTAHKDIVGTFSANDEMLRGVVSALKKLDKLKKVEESGHIVMVGVDGTPLGLERIRDGIQDASLNQDAKEMGKVATERMAMYFNGDTSYPKDTMLEPVLIDKNNVDDPNLWGNVMASKKK